VTCVCEFFSKTAVYPSCHDNAHALSLKIYETLRGIKLQNYISGSYYRSGSKKGT